MINNNKGSAQEKLYKLVLIQNTMTNKEITACTREAHPTLKEANLDIELDQGRSPGVTGEPTGTRDTNYIDHRKPRRRPRTVQRKTGNSRRRERAFNIFSRDKIMVPK